MIRHALALLALTLPLLPVLALPAAAQEEVLAGLSQSRISIDADFDGSEILIFGAIKRQAPVAGPGLEVIVTVSGPRLPVTVRRKDRFAGIWLNRDSVDVDAAPSFYAIATTSPLSDILSATANLRHGITIDRAIRSVGAPASIRDSNSFTEALIRIREEAELYQINENTIDLVEETLFDTSVSLPANLIEGNYTVRIFLTRGGEVVAESESLIYVQKVGLERFLYNLAYEQPLIYGILSIAIAIFAGWGASTVFRYIRS
ncbi:hypothetical protein EKE94_17380 [Mesobaculum littorinae]|uniref:Transmembrane protein (Alph_Pro_TM) n=1 Tax=Mesobaculum littorinae TaxID=2486419 RepID=A0A438ADD7_9RHOB|nr:TIGR02186 family protein [Mesobaculum littorinae]RVV96652.1 hypothetical protein EKE94_17380 [Mesobaculum littorinae]